MDDEVEPSYEAIKDTCRYYPKEGIRGVSWRYKMSVKYQDWLDTSKIYDFFFKWKVRFRMWNLRRKQRDYDRVTIFVTAVSNGEKE